MSICRSLGVIVGVSVAQAGPVMAQYRSSSRPTVTALVVYKSELVAGGGFTAAGGVRADCIARWDGTRWAPLGSGINGRVYELGVYNGELIAGGDFTTAGGVSASHIARWNGTRWAPFAGGMNGGAMHLTVYNGELIVGGDFTTVGGVRARDIARWNGTRWAPLGNGMGGNRYPITQVDDLTIYNHELIVGGLFTAAGSVSANHIARWNGTNWASLGVGMAGDDPRVPAVVFALTVYKDELIAGGVFTTAGGVTVNGIASWNGTRWASLGSGISGGVYAELPAVNALTVYNGELIAGGDFTTAGGVRVQHIARWKGTHWAPLGSGIMGSVIVGPVNALAVYNGRLIAGGRFTAAGGVRANCIARWDGTRWAPLGSGMDGSP